MYGDFVPMDVLTTVAFLFVHILQLLDLGVLGADDTWDGLTLKYGIHKKLPLTKQEAVAQNYRRINSVCRTNSYHGFLYRVKEDTKMIPIYDLDGKLAGIQAIIPGNMRGFNSLNESINLPPVDIMPPMLLGPKTQAQDSQTFIITAYFKHPKLVCNPFANVESKGKGLYIQTDYDPISHHIQIPMEEKDLQPIWKKAGCLPSMGLHYIYNMSVSLQCEKIYPVFLMYDREGKLGAFGWTFQGNPLDSENSIVDWFSISKDTYHFTFNRDDLPPCMFVPGFQIFGIHIWLQDHNKESMRDCKRPLPSLRISTMKYDPNTPPKNPVIVSKYKNGSSDNHICVIFVFFVTFFTQTLWRLLIHNTTV